MILPHNIDFIGAYMHQKPTKRVKEERVAPSIMDERPRAVFTGYWENPKITPDEEERILSYYTFPGEERVLAVLSNPVYEERMTKIRIEIKGYLALKVLLPSETSTETRIFPAG